MRAHTDTDCDALVSHLHCASYKAAIASYLTCCYDDANISVRLISLLYRSVDTKGGGGRTGNKITPPLQHV
jgi:hypothetical protein